MIDYEQDHTTINPPRIPQFYFNSTYRI